jgi:outer membrane protein TolC
VRQARQSVEAQRQALRATRGQRLPAVQLSTNYQRFAYPEGVLPDGWDETYPNWTVSLGLSVPLFTGGRIRGEEQVARANLVEAEQRLQQAKELAALDASVAVAELTRAEAAYAASAGTAQVAGRAYQIADVRYREGLSTQLELAETRVQLAQAQANRALAARNLQVARLRLALIRDLPLGTGAAEGAPDAGQGGAAGGAQGGQQQQPQSQGGAPGAAAGVSQQGSAGGRN